VFLLTGCKGKVIMIERIHLDPKLEKILAVLRKCGRRERLVADRVEAIIAEVKRGQLPPEEVASFTRNGEGRIRGCRKYDLGAGYRLITLKQGEDLYLLFAGTHDECGRWVENNREHLPLKMITERCRTVERSRPKAGDDRGVGATGNGTGRGLASPRDGPRPAKGLQRAGGGQIG
jgi:hypothetical protein